MSINKIDFKTLKNNVLMLLESSSYPLNSKQIASALSLRGVQQQNKIMEILKDLSLNGQVVEKDKFKYSYNISKQLIPGIIDINSAGNGYLQSPKHNEDIFIAKSNLYNCLNKDSVLVRIIKRKKHRIEGRVIEVVERATEKFIGTISIKNNTAFFIPDNVKTGSDFFIPKNKLNNAVNGESVIVRFLDWPNSAGSPFGEVIKKITSPDSLQAEIDSNIEIFNIRNHFNSEVKKETQNLTGVIYEKEIKKRYDMRSVKTFTIDPKDAKDYDDAISIESLNNGNFKIGVHIADVGHYVDPNSAIDKEAKKRGFSVYFPGRVIPMLPEKLSNEICSLKPKEDRLAFSITVEFNPKFEIIKNTFWAGKTVIHSDERLTYQEAQNIIDNSELDNKHEIILLNDIAKKMRFIRLKNGSINFERSDIQFVLDKHNEPLAVEEKTPLDSHKLVEEFMLLANKLIATRLSKIKQSIYRVHDLPDVDKLEELSLFLKLHNMKTLNTVQSPHTIALEINKLLKSSKSNNNKNVIELMILRSMAKAKYSTKNIGHYGLGFEKYTHFTSPIRRYADLIVHRILLKHLSNDTSTINDLENLCNYFSTVERTYIELERKVNKFAQLKLLLPMIGKKINGRISGVVNWGIYVDLDKGKGEGLVSVYDIKGDKYTFNEQMKHFIGSRGKEKLGLGKKVEVKIKSINLSKKEMDLVLI